MTALELKWSAKWFRRHALAVVTVFACLAVAVGTTATVLTLLMSLVLHPVSPDDASRIVHVGGLAYRPLGLDGVAMWGRASTFDALSTYAAGEAILDGESGSKRVRTATVAAQFFSVFSLTPYRGRFFSAEEEHGAETVAVISQTFAESYWADASAAVYQTVRLDGAPVVIVGVTAHGFDFPAGTELWVLRHPQGPIGTEYLSRPPSAVGGAQIGWVGRLRTGVSCAQAQTALYLLLKKFQLRSTDGVTIGSVISVVPLRQTVAANVKPTVTALLLAAACMLLIAAANASIVFSTIIAARRRDVAVMQALGQPARAAYALASVEAAAIYAGLVTSGAIVGYFTYQLLARYSTLYQVHLAAPQTVLNSVTFGTAAAALVATCVAFVAPVMRGYRIPPASFLNSREPHLAWRSARFRQLMLAVQTALTMVLSVGCILACRTLLHNFTIDLGSDPGAVLVAKVSRPAHQVLESPSTMAVLGLIRSQGMTEVAIANELPSQATGGEWVTVDGKTIFCTLVEADGDYFGAVGLPLIEGRRPIVGDIREAVISESAARMLSKTESPIGHLLHVGGAKEGAAIVGVVKDVADLADGRPRTAPRLYLQRIDWSSRREIFVLARCAILCTALFQSFKTTLRTAFPGYVIDEPTLLSDQLSARIRPSEFRASVSAAYALAALLFAMIGTYGLATFFCTARSAELALRMCLGATPWRMAAALVSESAKAALLGVLLGSALSIWMNRVWRSLLYGASVSDPQAVFLSAVLVICIVVGAAFVPAWRVSTSVPARLLHLDNME